IDRSAPALPSAGHQPPALNVLLPSPLRPAPHPRRSNSEDRGASNSIPMKKTAGPISAWHAATRRKAAVAFDQPHAALPENLEAIQLRKSAPVTTGWRHRFFRIGIPTAVGRRVHAVSGRTNRHSAVEKRHRATRRGAGSPRAYQLARSTAESRRSFSNDAQLE